MNMYVTNKSSKDVVNMCDTLDKWLWIELPGNILLQYCWVTDIIYTKLRPLVDSNDFAYN